MRFFLSSTLTILVFLSFIKPALAIVDPLASPNNKYGIHIISPIDHEILPAKDLINSSGGDWGYITVLIESKDRDHDKWQKVFNQLRELHLIPIIRLATSPKGNTWKRPYEGEEIAWVDFLDKLNWPTKNRYVVIYNEPNHGTEWGSFVDASSYAKVLNQTIDALKKKSSDFFVLNGGFDASAPQEPPNYQDEELFLEQMEKEIPGIFNKLDGWVSHSYPNPGFIGDPNDTGRGSIRTYEWELEALRNLGLKKNLPIFITETGWKHKEGVSQINSLPSTETVADYYKESFERVWSGPEIAAITPFLLNYQEPPFDHFSFKKKEDVGIINQIAGDDLEYHPQYYAIQSIPKIKGAPVQVNKATLTGGRVFPAVISGENYEILLKFKNTGQSIWNENAQVSLVVIEGKNQLGASSLDIPSNLRIKPGEEYTFHINLTAPDYGTFETSFNLFSSSSEFENKPFNFKTEVKAPAYIKVKASLKWKEDFAGNYVLRMVGAAGDKVISVMLNPKGQSQDIEARYLPPDLVYSFTLDRPFYQPITIERKINSGINELDFSELQPDIPSAILKPRELWNLLPFSN